MDSIGTGVSEKAFVQSMGVPSTARGLSKRSTHGSKLLILLIQIRQWGYAEDIPVFLHEIKQCYCGQKSEAPSYMYKIFHSSLLACKSVSQECHLNEMEHMSDVALCCTWMEKCEWGKSVCIKSKSACVSYFDNSNCCSDSAVEVDCNVLSLFFSSDFSIIYCTCFIRNIIKLQYVVIYCYSLLSLLFSPLQNNSKHLPICKGAKRAKCLLFNLSFEESESPKTFLCQM